MGEWYAEQTTFGDALGSEEDVDRHVCHYFVIVCLKALRQLHYSCVFRFHTHYSCVCFTLTHSCAPNRALPVYMYVSVCVHLRARTRVACMHSCCIRPCMRPFLACIHHREGWWEGEREREREREKEREMEGGRERESEIEQ